MPTISLRLVAFAALVLLVPLAAQDSKTVKETAPRLIRKVERQYSEQARMDKVEGTVTLKVIVGAEGHTSDIQIVKSLGARAR